MASESKRVQHTTATAAQLVTGKGVLETIVVIADTDSVDAWDGLTVTAEDNDNLLFTKATTVIGDIYTVNQPFANGLWVDLGAAGSIVNFTVSLKK